MIEICAFTAIGFEGQLVTVEVDMRRGLPGAEIIGLPDSAVKESKERVRVAIKNSGYEFPRERLLINLTPASIKKEGSAFDLAIALAILLQSEQVTFDQTFHAPILVLGELELSGRVRNVRGSLSAVAQALNHGVKHIILSHENFLEAQAITQANIWPVNNLTQAIEAVQMITRGETKSHNYQLKDVANKNFEVNIADIKGQPQIKRLLEIAVSGRHHFLLFGPPGCGKTLSCRALESILPPLDFDETLETSQIHSLKNELADGLLTHPPFRTPHHSASVEGIIGGGKALLPGEISMAHNGVLFMDEAPEFGKHLLQSLREPLENKRISIARANQSSWYPANFQLIMTANVCPCGALGRNDQACLCSPAQVAKYWKRMGSAILDRIDMRLPVQPVAAEQLLEASQEDSESIRQRIILARKIQQNRYQSDGIKYNSQLNSALLERYCQLEESVQAVFFKAMQKLTLSARAGHSILRVARTIADLEGVESIEKKHILEAASYRRYGDNDLYWMDV